MVATLIFVIIAIIAFVMLVSVTIAMIVANVKLKKENRRLKEQLYIYGKRTNYYE